MVNWRDKLVEAFQETGDDFNVMKTTLTDEELVKEFDDDLSSYFLDEDIPEGKEFTAWGETYVYFPIMCNCTESIGFAPRNVCDIKTPHW